MRKFTKLFSTTAALTLLISNLSAPAFAQFSIPSQSSPPISSSATLGQSIFPNLGSLSTQFVRPAAAAFSFLNQSGAALTDNSLPGPLTLKPASRAGASNLISLVLSQPVTPYTITALLQRISPIQGAYAGGLVLTDGTKYIFFGLANASLTGTQLLVVGRYTNVNLTTTAAIFWGFQSSPLVWLRVVNDGTNITYSLSYDRVDWLPVLTESKTAFLTISQVGWGLDTNDNGSSNQIPWLQLWYWVVS